MKHVKKLTIILLTILLLITSTMGCSSPNKYSNLNTHSSADSANQKANAKKTKKITINLAALKGPTGLGMLKLMHDNDAGSAANNYNITLASSPDQIVSKILSGEVDAAAMPTNLAATLYNKTNGKVQLAAVNTLGVLYLLTTDPKIKGVSDLKGKTIYASGQGAAPEYAFNYILSCNNLKPVKDVKIKYVAEHEELAALMISEKVSAAILPEPFVTQVLTKNHKIRIALDITKEWNKASLNKSVFTMGGLIVRKEFAEKNKDAFNAFLNEYKASAKYTVSNIKDAAVLSEKYGIMPTVTAQKAIPNCNIVYMDGSQMKEKISGFFKVLYASNPKSIGGKLPNDDFYYQK